MIILKENAEITPIQGHIILYCKFHYDADGVSRIEGLKRLWAARCAYDYDEQDNSCLEYIANDLFKIICTISNFSIIEFQKELHKATYNYYRDEEDTIMERIVNYYIFQLAYITVAEYNPISGRTKMLLNLPKPKKRLFKKIISGKGDYNDYKQLTLYENIN